MVGVRYEVLVIAGTLPKADNCNISGIEVELWK